MQSADPRLLTRHVSMELAAGRRVPKERGAHHALPSLAVERDVVTGGLASVAVRVGNSYAIACATVQVGPTEESRPDEGFVDFGVTTSGVAEPTVAATRDEHATRSRVVGGFLSRAFSGALDRRSLCIRPGEVCWVVKVDVRIIELDGDAAELCVAAVSALLAPGFTIPASRIIDGSTTEPVTVTPLRLPVAVTTGIAAAAGAKMPLTSPTQLEMLAVDAVVRVVVDASRDSDGGERILAVENVGRIPCEPAVFATAVANATSMAKAFRATCLAK